MINYKSPAILVPGIIGLLILIYGIIQGVWTFIILGIIVGLAGVVYSLVSNKETPSSPEETSVPEPEEPIQSSQPEQPQQPESSNPSF